jgi:AraC family transcriptional regulator
METTAETSPHRAETAEAYQIAIERVIGHMKTHLDEPLGLDQLARIAALSKFHLVRVFDELTGTTPHHFMACLRMQRAKELLLRSDESITNICMEVGYSSLGSFSKTFNALVGLSPQVFRQMPRKLDGVQFAKAAWRYLARRRKRDEQEIEGEIDGPPHPRGFTFVGTFNGGVPQGVPYSGSILLTRGSFRVKRPPGREFHLMAVLVPFTADLTSIVATIPVGLVASRRIIASDPTLPLHIPLQLRALRPTDPPIVLALPSLPPFIDAF